MEDEQEGAEHSCTWPSHPADELLDKLPWMMTAAAIVLIFPRDRGHPEGNRGPPALGLALAPPPPTLSAEQRLLEEQGGEGSLAWGSSPTLSFTREIQAHSKWDKKGTQYTSGEAEENTWGMQLQRKEARGKGRVGETGQSRAAEGWC